jgi:hypothetical protein
VALTAIRAMLRSLHVLSGQLRHCGHASSARGCVNRSSCCGLRTIFTMLRFTVFHDNASASAADQINSVGTKAASTVAYFDLCVFVFASSVAAVFTSSAVFFVFCLRAVFTCFHGFTTIFVNACCVFRTMFLRCTRCTVSCTFMRCCIQRGGCVFRVISRGLVSCVNCVLYVLHCVLSALTINCRAASLRAACCSEHSLRAFTTSTAWLRCCVGCVLRLCVCAFNVAAIGCGCGGCGGCDNCVAHVFRSLSSRLPDATMAAHSACCSAHDGSH